MAAAQRSNSTPKQGTRETCAPRGSDAIGGKAADWRAEMLARIRELIRQAEPEVVEEVKWRKPSNGMRGVPVWSRGGIVCTGETYRDKVKLTFAKGASLADPAGLFNAGLDGNVRRAIDLSEGDEIDEGAFQELVRAAVVLNTARRAGGARKKGKGG